MLVAKAQGKLDQEYSSALELIQPEIDAELVEVREVLDGLRNEGGDCWCVHFGSEYHIEECQRTQRLYKRLAQQ